VNILPKKYRSFLISATVIFMAVFLSGCWDLQDINERLIVTTICFDIKDGEVWYYMEIANTESGAKKGGSESSGTSKKYIVAKGHGKNLTEVRDNLNEKFDKPLYLSGVTAIVFTENFAKEYFLEYLYRFRSEEDYRKKSKTFLTKEDPEILYEAAHKENDSLGFLAEGLIETLDNTGKSFSRTTIRFLENISNNYSGFLVPNIGVLENRISLTGYSAISGSTPVGFIPIKEAQGVIWLKADRPTFEYIVNYNNIKFTIETKLKKRKFKPSYENGKINFDLNFEYKAELMYGDKKTPYNFDDTARKEVADILAGMLKEQLSDAIKRAQKEFKCDYLQFDDEFRVKFPTEYESMDWQKEFIDLSTKIDVKVDLDTKWGLDYGAHQSR
jgi:Ger(x)C family germination protein